MTNVFDVASYILKKQGEMTTLKLQKLVYYCQAWSLVWDEKPVYDEEIQAWANGPVEPDLFYKHQGQYKIADIPGGNADNVKGDSRDTVEMTLRRYGDKPAYWLVRLSHSEPPWIEAWYDCPPSQQGRTAINHASMAEYYSSLLEIDVEGWKETAEVLADPELVKILDTSKRMMDEEPRIPWDSVKKEFDIKMS